MQYFIYSKIQDRKDNALKGTYEYIVIDGEEIRITEKNETGISNYSDSVIVHQAAANTCWINVGYKRTKGE